RLAGRRLSEVLNDQGHSAQRTGLTADADGSMWIGALDRGLLRWRNGRLDKIDGAAGFPVSSVYGILEDEQGYFWMSSNHGIVRARRDELHAVANGTLAALTACQVFDMADGLPSPECAHGRQPVCTRDARGRLWFA